MLKKACLLLAATCLLQSVSVAKQPNVVLILADDMSPDLSMLGTPGIETPNIDAFAKEGVYFNNAFAASASCSPSRTAILTGMWPHSNGNWRNVHTPPLNLPDKAFSRETHIVDKVGIGRDVATLPEVFQSNGYFTAITQKLHLSPAWRYPYDARNPVQSEPKRFHKVMGDFIEQAGDRPFFIHANVAAPHRPYRAHLKSNPDQELPAADSIEVPSFLPDTPGVRRDMQEYYACVEIADACVGAILQALDDAGIREETFIIFTSDQGMPIHYAKASAYPTGTRIPLAVVGPGVVKGQTNDSPVSQIDYAPTILDYCGIEIPEVMQGESLRPILSGGDSIEGREYVFAEHNSHGPDPREFYPQRVVTDGNWYYILNVDPEKTQRLPDDLRGVEVWGNHAYDAIIAAKESHPAEYAYLTLFDKPRQPEHLYKINEDKWGVHDLATNPERQAVLQRMRAAMHMWRTATNDIEKSPLEIPEQPDAH
ncbi:sulfatase [Coraliomargarita sp. SDUM461003]|uniref:Sulfatase n=1 Tax=Thalassobacterium maritimum TaxID=3041265 RepID=A0ABU1AUR6_9BACT|nr:sulfatase [Coraliomargarita sp. SDUM461003]MDQ8207911.1 sulfatase [Coraliomargarita sp. SDUM461003]